MGGLGAPEDDQEPNENLMKGPIAHKVVELLVNKNDNEAYSLDDIQSRFNAQYDELFEQAMEAEKECATFLKRPENVNMLALFKEEAKQSIEQLIELIKEKQLTPIRSEYELTTRFDPFENPHGFIDLLLEDAAHNLVIIDLKWSNSKTYPDKIKNGEAYQLYMYKHAVEAQTAKTVAWYAYYLFPEKELYVQPDGVNTKWGEWIEMRKERLSQLSDGIIEPVVEGSDKDKYPKHIILKNTKNKMK